jgi:uncharacterized protein
MRIGIVLSSSGGMLAKILPLFKLGLGGRIGNGNQYISWIALDDLLGLVLYAIVDESITGPVNAVSPNPVTNADFTATLGKVLSRPTNPWKGYLILGNVKNTFLNPCLLS